MLRIFGNGELKGWVRQGGCENPSCRRAIKAGRTYHAVPAGYAVTLPDYHFTTPDAAAEALAGLKGRATAPPPHIIIG